MFEGRLVFHDGVSEQILTYDTKIPGSYILQLMNIFCKMRSGHIFHFEVPCEKITTTGHLIGRMQVI
jgi:hypothetical protein